MKQNKSKTIKQLKAELDRVFSLYIRQKNAVDGIVQCVTCKKHYRWQDVDCGHFLSRRYTAIRWTESNAGPQCKADNIFHQGRQFEFALALKEKYGEKEVEKLMLTKNNVCKMDRFKYLTLIEIYKAKLNKGQFSLNCPKSQLPPELD